MYACIVVDVDILCTVRTPLRYPSVLLHISVRFGSGSGPGSTSRLHCIPPF